MANRDNFPAIFETLKTLLQPYVPPLRVQTDSVENLTLLANPTTRYPEGMFFASVHLGKSYVSFHLMPLYMDAEMQAAIPDSLRKRMQGKTCFNFSTLPDDTVLGDLARLTAAGYAHWQRGKLIS